MKRAAVICATGIGDGLVMMIAAARLKKAGYEVTIDHDKYAILSPLFPCDYKWGKTASYEIAILQNDHSKRAERIIGNRNRGLRVFFPKKSPWFQKGDFLCNRKKSVASNLAQAMDEWFGENSGDKENDLLPRHGSHRSHTKRIILHPTSADPKKVWLPLQFLLLAERLKSKGYSPVFTVAKEDEEAWNRFAGYNFPVVSFDNLNDLADYIYESGSFIGNDSGLAHLASNVGIPSLVINGNAKIAKLWKPDWAPSHVLTPSLPLPNFKGIHFRMREWAWPLFTSVNKVISGYEASCGS